MPVKCNAILKILLLATGGLFSALFVSSVFALGLGEVTIHSSLNEPLDATIEVFEVGGLDESQMIIGMASQADFDRVNVQRIFLLDQVEFAVEKTSASTARIHLTTSDRIVEPYLNFLVSARWPTGRLIREYTVLLDLPTFSQAPAPAVQPALESPVNNEIADNVRQAKPELEEPQQPKVTQLPQQTEVRQPILQENESALESNVEGSLAEQQEVQEVQEIVEQEMGAVPEPEGIVGEIIPEPSSTQIAENIIPAQFSDESSVVIQTNDTLWEIALAARPDNFVTVHQMMLAIQRVNPDAFIDGNINRIKEGRVLRIPSMQAILSLDQQEAVLLVASQNQQMLGVAPQPLAVNRNEDVESVAQVNVDQLRVLSADDVNAANSGNGGESENSGTISLLQNQLALSEESLDRAQIENIELNERLTEMDAEIALLQNIIQIEDQRLAQLQDSLTRQQEVARQAEVVPAIAAVTELDSVVTPDPTPTAPPTQVVQSLATDTSLMGKISDFFQDTMVLVGALVALIAFALGFLLWRGREQDEDDAALENEYSDESESYLFEDEFNEAEFEQAYADEDETLEVEENFEINDEFVAADFDEEYEDEPEDDEAMDVGELVASSYDDPDINTANNNEEETATEEVEFALDDYIEVADELEAETYNALSEEEHEYEGSEEDDSLDLSFDKESQDNMVVLGKLGALMSEYSEDPDVSLDSNDEELERLEMLTTADGADSDDQGLETVAESDFVLGSGDDDLMDSSTDGIDIDSQSIESMQVESEISESSVVVDDELIDIDIESEDESVDSVENLVMSEDAFEIQFEIDEDDNDAQALVEDDIDSTQSSDNLIEFPLNAEVFKIPDDHARASLNAGATNNEGGDSEDLGAFDFSLSADDDDQEFSSLADEIDSVPEDLEEMEFALDDMVTDSDEDVDVDAEISAAAETTVKENMSSPRQADEEHDQYATKLDLAVAYEAMGDFDGARSILREVVAAGSEAQAGEARKLLEKQ